MKGAMRIILFLLFLGSTLTVLAQEDHDHENDGPDHHHESKNEIGGAIGMVFNMKEQNTSSGFHFHYMRMFGGKLKRFGVAPGVGFLLGDHRHYSMHVMFSYRPTHGWWIAVGPGVTYFNHDNEWKASGHIETGYEFDAGKVHFGPVAEFAWAAGDQHIMVGLHLGVPF
jgi:hypothetical protein